VFTLPKKDGGFRLIVDLRHVNTYLQPLSCAYETLDVVQTIVKPDDFLTSIDLKDGFFHLEVARPDRKYLQVCLYGQHYQICVLPFGLAASPYFFTKFLRPVIRHIRSTLGRASLYVDDLLLAAAGRRESNWLTLHVAALYSELGLTINAGKSELEPVQQIRHLGLEINATQQSFRIPDDKRRAVEALASHLLTMAMENNARVPSAALARFCGTAQSLRLAVPPANLILRPLYDAMRQRKTYQAWVRLGRAALQTLRWWRGLSRTPIARLGALFRDTAPIMMHTDASPYGWGAALDGQVHAQGRWTPEEAIEPIHLLEVRAVTRALEAFDLWDATVRLGCDNLAAVYSITSLRSRSPRFSEELLDLWNVAFERNVALRPLYLPTQVNVWADRLSRVRVTLPGRIRPDFLSMLEERFSQPISIRLLTPWVRVDGRPANELRVPWEDDVLHLLSPPWELIPEVLRLLPAPALLLYPEYRAATWWPELRARAGTPLAFPKDQVYEIPFRGVTDVVRLTLLTPTQCRGSGMHRSAETTPGVSSALP